MIWRRVATLAISAASLRRRCRSFSVARRSSVRVPRPRPGGGVSVHVLVPLLLQSVAVHHKVRLRHQTERRQEATSLANLEGRPSRIGIPRLLIVVNRFPKVRFVKASCGLAPMGSSQARTRRPSATSSWGRPVRSTASRF